MHWIVCKIDEVWEHFDSEFKVANFALAYMEMSIMVPLDDEYDVNSSALPAPCPQVVRGRPQIRHIRSRGEAGPASVYRRRIRRDNGGDIGGDIGSVCML